MIYTHPVYQYFERRYELPGQSLHWEPDTMPTDEQWQALARIQKEGALFIWEAEPDQDIVACKAIDASAYAGAMLCRWIHCRYQCQ